MTLARLSSVLIGPLLTISSSAFAQDEWRKAESTVFLGLFGPGDQIAYDPVRERLLVFGGLDHPPHFTVEFWERNGGSWTGMGKSGGFRRGGAMAWDPNRREIITFGGYEDFFDGVDRMGAWDGNEWREIQPATKPPRRYRHAMATDTHRDRVMVFGGATGFLYGYELSDTWEWDGESWTERHPLHSPPARVEHSMAYDPIRQRLVMFGGWAYDPEASEQKVYSNTWEWDGEDWTEHVSPVTPSLDRMRMVFDTKRQRTLLVGTKQGAFQTWEWSGGEWHLETTSHGPKPTTGWTLVHDETRQETVLLALDSDDNNWFSWIYSPPEPIETEDRTVSVQGAGRHGLFPGPSVPARWALMTSGTPGVSGVGTATLPIPIPDDPSLLGLETYWQGFVWDPGSPLPSGVSYTHGLRVTLIR